MTISETMSDATEAAVFSFGEPEAVLNQYDLLYYGCWNMSSKYYELPFDISALAKLYRATPHHGSALQVKRNILLRTLKPTKWMDHLLFKKLVQDFLVFGNCYPTAVRNRLGDLVSINAPLARYVRRGTDLKSYYWVTGWLSEEQFPDNSVYHLMEPSLSQEVYGEPDYLGALQSVQLNEASTLFRRRYFENGSHAGFIMYMTDAAQQQGDIDNLRKALKDSKGPGNFRNLFMYAPNGKKDGLQLIPVSEVAAKDDFRHIKDISRDDQLAAHRVPPQLMGIIPNNTGGFGDVEKAANVFAANEIEPIHMMFKSLNDQIGEKVFDFSEYRLQSNED